MGPTLRVMKEGIAESSESFREMVWLSLVSGSVKVERKVEPVWPTWTDKA